MSERIAIYCADASHPQRRPEVHVETFERGGVWNVDDGWAAVGRRGRFLSEGYQAVPGTPERVRLVCRKCPSRPVVVVGDKLNAALDVFATRGVERVSLTLLAATIQVLAME